MGFGKFTIMMLLVIVLGALAVVALPGGETPPFQQVTREHPWKSFASGKGNFEVPLGWLAYDPFTRVAFDGSIGGCHHIPPRHCRAAYFRSPGQRVELFLAFGPASRLSSLLPVIEREGTDTIAALATSTVRVNGEPLRWNSWDPDRSRDSGESVCLVGSMESGENLFLVHVNGRPENADLVAIVALLKSIQLPGS